MEISPEALAVAAERVGLSPIALEHALREYHSISEALHDEPEWAAICHMSGAQWAMAQHSAAGTTVTMQIESQRANRESPWKQHPRDYVFDGKVFATFGEARAAELRTPVSGPTGHNVAAFVSPCSTGAN